MNGMRIIKSAGLVGSILKVTTIWILVLGVLALLAPFGLCTFGKSQGSATGKKTPVRIILDTDFGDDGDDLAALAVMHHLADLGEVEILAIGQSNSRWDAPGAIDSINTYYGRPDIPIGQVDHKTHEGDQYSSFLVKNYEYDLDLKNVPTAVDVYRRALADAPDKSVKFVVVGFKSNMRDLLQSRPDDISPLSGIELVRKKVILASDMAGRYPSQDAKSSYNFRMVEGAAKYYVENWPTPMVFAGIGTGGIKVGMRLRKLDTPVGRAMELKLAKGWRHGEKYQAGFDLASLLVAARGADRYFNTKSGCNIVGSDGANTFDYDRDCGHRHIDSQNRKVSYEEIGEMLEEMMLAGPKNPAGTYAPQVILDTDAKNEVDDQHYIAYGLFSEVEILGINSVHHGGGQEATNYAEIKHVIDLARKSGLAEDRDPPVFHGADRRLIRPDSGKWFDTEPIVTEASEAILAAARRASADNPVWVLPVGPCTNIASAILQARQEKLDLSKRIRICWLGGGPQHAHKNTFNGGNDPWSVYVTAQSGVDFWIMLENPTGASLTIDKRTESGLYPDNPLGKYLLKITPNRHKSLYDLTTISMVIDDHLGRHWLTAVEPAGVLGPDHNYLWKRVDGASTVHIIRNIDEGVMKKDFFDTLNGRPAALASSSASGPKAADQEARIPVIYDSDIGDDIDDTWAMSMLLRCPELDVKLVVGDQGKPEYRTKLFAKFLEIAKRTDIPIGVKN